MPDFGVPSGITSLTESIKQGDPTLYNILTSLTGSINAINESLNPPVASGRVISNPTIVPDDVTNFVYTLTLDNIIFDWDAADLAVTYEIRKGSSWNTASYVTTLNGLQAILDPVAVGTTTYLIKAIGSNGQYSTNAASVAVIIPVIPAPVVTTNAILNTAILSWTAPASSFRIDHYLIYKSGTPLTTINGTFFPYQESAAGTYSYGIAAVDIFGNIGTTQNVSITVSAPSDFLLQAILTSTFTGTKTNAFLDSSRTVLEVCLDITETYHDHFNSRGWASPQDQINAGYPIYGEPGQATASYVEVFDFGSIFTNVVIGLTWSFTLIANVVSIASQLEFSNDNITYTAPVAGPTAFAASARYVRATVNFTGGTTDILEFFNFQCAMSVHREMDGGSGTANSGDAGGTVFSFNKTFKAVESVTATPETTNSYKAVVTGVTTTQFKVLVFDDTGTRKTVTIDWKARGIL